MPFPSLKAIGNFINLGIANPVAQAILAPVNAIAQVVRNIFPTPGSFVSFTAYGSAFGLFVYNIGRAYKTGLDEIDDFGAGGLLMGGFALLMSTFSRFLAQDSNGKKTFTGVAMGFSITGFGVFLESWAKGKVKFGSPLWVATVSVFALGALSGILVLQS